MRSTKVCLLLAAIVALAGPAAAQAGEWTISPGGSVTAEKPLIIDRYGLSVSPYPAWSRRERQTCDITLDGTAFTGPIADDAPLMEFGSGRVDDCTATTALSFGAGSWTLTGVVLSGGTLRGHLRNVQISMSVGGATCDYVAGSALVVGTISSTPILVGATLFTSFDTSWFAPVATSYIYASPRSAACGAIRIEWGDPWLIGPGQTITGRV